VEPLPRLALAPLLTAADPAMTLPVPAVLVSGETLLRLPAMLTLAVPLPALALALLLTLDPPTGF
jgi:hypothetical protein